MSINYNLAVGRRKTSTARVYLIEGSGNITVNNKKAQDYFKNESYVKQLAEP